MIRKSRDKKGGILSAICDKINKMVGYRDNVARKPWDRQFIPDSCSSPRVFGLSVCVKAPLPAASLCPRCYYKTAASHSTMLSLTKDSGGNVSAPASFAVCLKRRKKLKQKKTLDDFFYPIDSKKIQVTFGLLFPMWLQWWNLGQQRRIGNKLFQGKEAACWMDCLPSLIDEDSSVPCYKNQLLKIYPRETIVSEKHNLLFSTSRQLKRTFPQYVPCVFSSFSWS